MSRKTEGGVRAQSACITIVNINELQQNLVYLIPYLHQKILFQHWHNAVEVCLEWLKSFSTEEVCK